MISDEVQARKWVADLGICDDKAIERLKILIGELALENARQNLVSASSLSAVWQRHIADSAQLLTHVSRETRLWLDLGTGAGFPGLVAAILQPYCEVHLVESRKRRVEWLERITSQLEIKNICIHGKRLELVDSFKADAISARAFAALDKLLSLSARFSTSSTVWLLPKGRSAQHELDELKGWRHTFHVERSLTDPDAGVIVGALLGRKGRAS